MSQQAPAHDAKVWLITGCSSGFGRELVLAARKRGDLVVATARKIETLEELKTLGCEVLALDVTSDDATVNEVVAKAHAFYGRIDVLVNNAGQGAAGAIEEASTEDIQAAFDVNVFGLVRVTRAVLPYMREKRSGVIANIGSAAGYSPFPPVAVYGAAKYAVAGFSLALRMEVESFGIKVTVIEPTMFKTNGNASAKIFANHIAEYDAAKQARMGSLAGKFVVGDAAKAAQAMVEALTQSGRCTGREIPSRLAMGGGSYELCDVTLAHAKKELDEWKDFTTAEMYALEE
ncbi:hypothetical protein Poli38472_007571 [Pythium oligandrum]|uniref:Uncharacterized protein n=1 Tax=Pythium oligandrum TaxID=41045 RepID=A0A8K1CQS6_PYTOL|nr:hypothetical protein Poli38472_007571 [Pythium oligandrum]|eukprot:TMW67899.1 hypothetical protein Poli38472_007571 [Pythium oligandrum]